jgi:cytochrome c5
MKAFYVAVIGATSLLAVASVNAATPEENYKASCSACHDAGVAGAPKMGDKAAWAPRIKNGKEALYKVGISGKPGTAMMAKGGAASLPDADVKAIVDLMIAKAK